MCKQLEYSNERPPSPPHLRSEVVPEVHEIRHREVVELKTDLNTDKVDNFMNNRMAFIEQVF